MPHYFLFFLLPFFQFIDNAPVQWLSDQDYEFTEVILNEPATCFFRFKNTTDEPIIIDNVRTTCGCTAPNWSVEPIEPQTVSEIKVVFDAKKPGYFKKKIRVFFSNQKRAEILTIQGIVE
ncbi:MAG: DUF1573 domain-containing protein [Saprospiraceae bacterium]